MNQASSRSESGKPEVAMRVISRELWPAGRRLSVNSGQKGGDMSLGYALQQLTGCQIEGPAADGITQFSDVENGRVLIYPGDQVKRLRVEHPEVKAKLIRHRGWAYLSFCFMHGWRRGDMLRGTLYKTGPKDGVIVFEKQTL